jgi:hypothetical protein
MNRCWGAHFKSHPVNKAPAKVALKFRDLEAINLFNGNLKRGESFFALGKRQTYSNNHLLAIFLPITAASHPLGAG